MRSLIAVAALLASVSANAGELDGKQIICPGEFGAKGFEFVDGRVIGTAVQLVAYDKAGLINMEFGTEDRHNYKLTTGNVYWGSWRLNRKTLVLDFVSREGEVWPGSLQCELSPSKIAFTAYLERSRLAEQKILDEEMKDNEI